ncbi:MAG: hypothetical protein SO187_02670 [Bacilli bacterium]|nr:hypothetical protein [Bacilli bacterium]
MKRLTKKIHQFDKDGNIEVVKIIKDLNIVEACEKLYEYENIEELCEKMVSQPIYEKYGDTDEIHEEDFKGYTALYNFKERRIELYYEEYPIYFELDSYGEKWSFCCEDLEEDHEEMWSIYREVLENGK